MDFSKYMNRIVEIDWEGKNRTRAARLRERRPAQQGRGAASHVRTRSGDAQSQYVRRHDRQQLVRHARADGWQDRRERRGARHRHLRRPAYARRPDVGRRARAHHRGRRPQGRNLRGNSKPCATSTPTKIREIFPDIPRRVSGFPLNELLPENGFNVARALVGTESTCVTVVEATVRLVHSPPHRAIAIFGFPDLATAADHVPFCDEHGPIALEGMAASMFEFMKLKGESDTRPLDVSARRGMVDLRVRRRYERGGGRPRARRSWRRSSDRPNPPSMKFFDDHEQQEQFWAFRDNALGATSKIPNQADYYPGWEDSAVDPKRLGDYIRKFQAMLDEYGYKGSIYGHFGQACVHVSINFDLFTAAGIAKYREFVTQDGAHLRRARRLALR